MWYAVRMEYGFVEVYSNSKSWVKRIAMKDFPDMGTVIDYWAM